MTQMQLAAAAETSQSVISEMERGTRWPEPETQVAIADALGCDWLELWVDPDAPSLDVLANQATPDEKARMAEMLRLFRAGGGGV